MRKSIELIAVDLDGTLLDSRSRISNKNKEAIGKCLGRGIKVVLSTGKSIIFVEKIIKELRLVDPQIVYGGTAVIDRDSNILAALKIPKKSCIEVIKMTREWGKGCAIGTTDGFVYYEKSDRYLKYLALSGEPLIKVNNLVIDEIVENSLLFTITIDENDRFNDFLKLNIGEGIKTRRGGPYYLNILNKKAGKVFGIKKVLKLTGIRRNNVMAIGDNENDLGIIKFAGTGVAVGNSPEIIKKISRFCSRGK